MAKNLVINDKSAILLKFISFNILTHRAISVCEKAINDNLIRRLP